MRCLKNEKIKTNAPFENKIVWLIMMEKSALLIRGYLSLNVRKPVFGVTDTNRAVQRQKMVRDLKFRIKELEGLFYLCSENKGDDQLISCAVTAQLICVFVFAYAKCRFSHDAAHFEQQQNRKKKTVVMNPFKCCLFNYCI